MKRFILAAMAAALFCGPVLADNFQFTVPAEPGLRLKITGYAADGSKMFEETAQSQEVYNNNKVYVIRVDESILQSARLKEWCVEDTSGEWHALPADGSSRMICDNKPSETRGSYDFVARRNVSSSAAAIVCVQDELNALGFNAGTADGVLGGKTQQAAAAYVQFAKQSDASFVMPSVTADNARMWCETVAKQNPAVARFWTAIK